MLSLRNFSYLLDPITILAWKCSPYSCLAQHVIDPKCQILTNSGFPSKRINLSPFTKDFRGGEQLNESHKNFY